VNRPVSDRVDPKVRVAMRANQRLILEAAYASWEDEDLSLLGRCLHENAVSFIHLPDGTWPMSGVLRGRKAVLDALGRVARDFEVIEYRPTKMSNNDGVWTCRARLHYLHRETSLSYEATISNVWTMVGDRITSYEVFHDAERMRAFFEMVSRMSVEA
jgi:ketosteroid isomerase-like protein